MTLDFQTVLFDVDGTLIDSNGAHAETWAQALREHRIDTDASRLRPLIGMGGDKLLPTIAGIEEDSTLGRAIGERKKTLFAAIVHTLRPTRGARQLVEFLSRQGVALVTATSADEHEMSTLLKQAGVDDLFPVRASKDDAPESKPDPDIVHAALQRSRASADSAVMVGDTPYDITAATKAGVRTFALRSGGHWTDDDFQGASQIFDDPAALLEHLAQS